MIPQFSIALIVILVFALCVLLVLLKSFNLPDAFYKRQQERNELRKQVIRSQIPLEEAEEEKK